MKKLILIITLIVSNLTLSFDNTGEGKFIYNLEQDSDYFHQKINLKTISPSIKKRNKNNDLNIDDFNDKNIMSFRLGIQQEEYEEKLGFFVSSLTPSFDLTFYKKMNEKLNFDFDFQVSKNNGIFRQSVMYSILNLNSITLSPLLRFGQKLAFTDQVNSGYIFFNLGSAILYEGESFTSRLDVYSSPTTFDKLGFYSELSYRMKNNDVGIYFAQEHYDQLDLEYSRQGQSTSRFGFIVKF
jgi:hypothetical protein